VILLVGWFASPVNSDVLGSWVVPYVEFVLGCVAVVS
jgi:hypothetical protein